MKVAEIEGAELDYWVFKALGFDPVMREVWHTPTGSSTPPPVQYEAKYKRGGLWHVCRPCDQFLRIIEREKISLNHQPMMPETWLAGWIEYTEDGEKHLRIVPQYGPTPLIAAMRCYVASKFGDEVSDE